ncbi:hypothetical protein [Campylobacter concisus]|nr:hypothetical protein [Campylobacter concisus]
MQIRIPNSDHKVGKFQNLDFTKTYSFTKTAVVNLRQANKLNLY